MKCVKGIHEWLDPDSAKLCCNGYYRALRASGEPRLQGEVKDGAVFDGVFWHVWVDSKNDGELK
jgi:hypothetical protein